MVATPKHRAAHDAFRYRKLDQQQIAANEDPPTTVMDDARFDSITEKVIQFMDQTDPADWTGPQWALFKTLWQDRKTKRVHLNDKETTALMSTQELQALMRTDDP